MFIQPKVAQVLCVTAEADEADSDVRRQDGAWKSESRICDDAPSNNMLACLRIAALEWCPLTYAVLSHHCDTARHGCVHRLLSPQCHASQSQAGSRHEKHGVGDRVCASSGLRTVGAGRFCFQLYRSMEIRHGHVMLYIVQLNLTLSTTPSKAAMPLLATIVCLYNSDLPIYRHKGCGF